MRPPDLTIRHSALLCHLYLEKPTQYCGFNMREKKYRYSEASSSLGVTEYIFIWRTRFCKASLKNLQEFHHQFK